MFDGISPSGWLVIVCALALGFGMVRFLIVTMNEKSSQAHVEHARLGDHEFVQSANPMPPSDARGPSE